MEDEHKCDCPAGAPMWIVTFSDLMSLMLTFFVLILSFSELDAQKFKKASGSIRLAFGVQREMIREQIPLGISVVAENYSPGQPTVLDFDLPPFVTTDSYALERRRLEMLLEDMQEIFKKNLKVVENMLGEQATAKKIEIIKERFNIKIQFAENKAFFRDSDKLKRDFLPVLEQIAQTLRQVQGKVQIKSHAAGNFKKSDYFRNSWELTSAQSAVMTNALAKFTGMPSNRFEARGYGDSKKVSTTNEDKNRRIEIEIAINPQVMKELGY